MTLIELCRKIDLQDEIVQRVMNFTADFDFSPLDARIHSLTAPETAAEAHKALKELLGDDPLGTKILCCYLRAALTTYDNYRALGIDEQIYVDTMKCFPRFIGECLERKDVLAFDRAHWNHRHLSMSILRIGTLEYERKIREGVRVNAIHIPTDADFSPTALDASFTAARALTREKFPDYADAPITCESWLIYEGLRDVLKEGSKILQFQARFDIQCQHPISDGYLTFIFHRADCSDYANLPESSSLQRNVKARLLAGSGIGGGFGILREE